MSFGTERGLGLNEVFMVLQLSKKYIQIYRYVFVNCKIISKIQIKDGFNLCFNGANHHVIYCTIDHIIWPILTSHS